MTNLNLQYSRECEYLLKAIFWCPALLFINTSLRGAITLASFFQQFCLVNYCLLSTADFLRLINFEICENNVSNC